MRTKFNSIVASDFFVTAFALNRFKCAIRCLLATIMCIFALAYPVHAQTYVYEWFAGSADPTNCESTDAVTSAWCNLQKDGFGAADILYPRDYPNCGIAGYPNGVCTFVWGCSAGTSCAGNGGTFQILAEVVSPLYFVSTDSVALTDCGCDKNNNNKVSDPISPSNGNVSLQEIDIPAQGQNPQSAFIRYYNSVDPTVYNGTNPSHTDLGRGWHHSFTRMIVANVTTQPYQTYFGSYANNSSTYTTQAAACTFGWAQISASSSQWPNSTASFSNGACSLSQGGSVVATIPVRSGLPIAPTTGTYVSYDVIRDDGQDVSFTVSGSSLVAPAGSPLRLSITANGYQVIDDDDNVELYNSNGQLLSVTSRAGIVETMAYDGSNRLSTITDSFGRQLVLNYNSQNLLTSVTDPASNTVQYGIDSYTRLATVTNLDHTTRTYVYENTTFPLLLTGIIDENAARFSTWGYDSYSRANSTQEAGGANATSLTYNSNGTVTETDALGAVRTFSFKQLGNQNRVASISGSQCPTCDESASTTYDAAGYVASRTDYNGNLTCYANDPTRGLELVRVEGIAPGSTCPSSLSSYTPASGTLQRKITTTWNTTWREPAEIDEPNRTITFAYFSTGMLQTKTVKDLTVSPNVTRAWNYTYNSYGQPLTIKGPRGNGFTDLTTIAYYPCPGTYCGQVETITNQVGQMTTFNTYDAYGQPLTITDPNGVVTTLTYDTRERLYTSQVATETTQYRYWPTGLLELLTLPDSSTFQFSYDNAHRLTKITDTAGNYIQYSLDALGNRTGEAAYDSSGVQHRNHTRQFNTLGQLSEDINAANTSAVTTSYFYDSQGNQTNVNAPLSRNTIKGYDALNRLKQVTDPNSGITYLGYDANDNLASVQDPRTFTTSYSHNGFNDLTQVVSPDTGTTSYVYDSGGNPKTITDARGAAANLTFDDANRLTKAAYSDQTITYTWDSGTNGRGRLTGASDAYHSMSWTYDALGRVSGKGQTVASVTKSVGYSYNNGDLITLVTPSGQTVTYGYTNHQITSIKVGSTTLLSGVTYDPFGPATGWTWGNGTTTSKSFDLDGNPAQIVTAGVTNTYAVDAASRITQLTDGGLSSNTWNFTAYDSLDRIKTASSSAKSRGYTYDANGNVSKITGTTASTETISATNNQLTATSGAIVRSYGYDAAGNTTSYTGETFTFNQRGRMSSADSSAGTTNYVYNALGQLIEKSGIGGTTLLMYDEVGHLLGEYTSAGALIQETVWMGDTPVATLQPNGTSVSIYYVHTDHLGTPRKVTRPSDNGLMWRYDPDTYGASTTAANSNPAGLGTFVYNLRLPGQYFLSESGLSYNYFRTYDPAVGRYVESDPIGLRGGQLSTYGYVDNNPISNIDPRGTGPFGAAIGGILGGVGGFVGGTAVGAGGGTLVAPGVGTVAGGVEGAYVGTVGGALAGAAIGDRVGDWLENLIFSRSNPFTGKPGSETTCPGRNGGPKQTRRYGPDGYPEADTDWDHDHGQGQPHTHDWDRPANGGPPTDANRGPGRSPQPGDPGIP